MTQLQSRLALSLFTIVVFSSAGCGDPAKGDSEPRRIVIKPPAHKQNSESVRFDFGDGPSEEETKRLDFDKNAEQTTKSFKDYADPRNGRATDFGKKVTSHPFLVYPQFAEAKAKPLGVVELTFSELTDRAPTNHEEQAIEVASRAGKKPLHIKHRTAEYHVYELRAYRPGGEELTRDEILKKFEQPGVVLATIAPASPEKQYLDALREDAIVLEVPYEPNIRVDLASSN